MNQDLLSLKNYTIRNEDELKILIEKGKINIYQEIKNIPNPVKNLKLSLNENCSNLRESNPLKEIEKYTLRYVFEDKSITGTWRFASKYGFSLKKNITCNYGINEILFIKEPFVKDINDKIMYQYNSDRNDIKYTNQRFMKQNESRYFIQIIDMKVEKIENFYLDNVRFEKNKTELVGIPFSWLDKKSIANKPHTLEQKLFSHKYVVRYECKLINNPFDADFVPTNKKQFFYRVQIPSEYSKEKEFNDYISWKDFEMGYIEATSKKEAREKLEEEFNCKLPSKVLKSEYIISKYKYILKVYESDPYWDSVWGDDRECNICGSIYNIIDKVNNTGNKGNMDCCSEECESVEHQNREILKGEEYLYKKLEENKGIHLPCIYKISNIKTGMAYIGQTTQTPTFRWYQHFSCTSGTKFYDAIGNSDITDWTFEVLETITREDMIKENSWDKNVYINKREQFWINHYDSINKGYNTATANKELSDIKKLTTNGLFKEDEL